MTVQIKYRGLDEIDQKLNQVEKELTGAPIVRALKDSTLYVTRDARKNAPVDTGALRASIMPDVQYRMYGGQGLVGVVGSNKEYAPFPEFGTRPHWPPIAALEGWARRHGTTAFVVARAIARRGTKAVRYMGRALEDNTDKIIRRFEKAIKEIVNK